MSTQIDHRVVEMKFDNKQFEEGISQSLKSLQNLENSLDSKNFAKGFDISGVIKPLEYLRTVSDPIVGAGIRAFTRLADAAVDQGARMLKALSIDNVAAGWQKFAEKTTSVGTLIAQGYDMETVNEQLERLNWFTDETSYNFTDMVNSIGKFTATGKGLEESVSAMEGIANWAALSGQNAATASRAMYQISQAMGAGYFRLEDYKSIQNASMDTDEFRQKAIDAAIALGTLRKEADGTYRTVETGTAFTKSSFTEALTKGKWFTSDVMLKVFNEYGAAVNQLYDYSQKEGTTASEAIEALGNSVDSFGLKAFKAAQEARTFSDVIDSVKDAASTSFMNTFELIIGNYEQATKVYTDMANTLYDVFAEPINQLNEFLEESLSGDDGKRLDLLQSLANIGTSLIETWNLVKESMMDVFEFNDFMPITVEQFQNAIDKLKEFTEGLILQDDYIRKKLEKTLAGFFSIIDIGFNIVKRVFGLVEKVFDSLKPGIDIVLSITGGIGDFFRILDNSINTIGFYQTFISEGWRPLAYAKIALDNVRKSLEKTFENNPKAKEFYDNCVKIFEGLGIIIAPMLDLAREKIEEFVEFSTNAFDEFIHTKLDIAPGEPVNLDIVIEKLAELTGIARDFVNTKIESTINMFMNGDGIDVQSFLDSVGKMNILSEAVRKIRWFVGLVITRLKEMSTYKVPTLAQLNRSLLIAFYNINKVIAMIGFTALHIVSVLSVVTYAMILLKINKLIGNIVDSFNTLANTLKALQWKLVSEGLLYMAGAVGILAGVFYLMSKIDWHADGINQAGVAILTLMGMMYLIMGTLKFIDGEALESAAKYFIAFAGAIALLSIVFTKLKEFFQNNATDADLKAMEDASNFMWAFAAFLAIFGVVLGKFAPELSKNSIALVAIAFSIGMLSNTFTKLVDWYEEHKMFDFKRATDMMKAFALMIAAMGIAVAVMQSQSGGFWKSVGTAMAVTAAAAGIGRIIKAMAALSPEQMSQIKDMSTNLVLFFVVLGAIFAGLSALQKSGADVVGVGKTLKGVLSSLVIVAGAFWILNTIPFLNFMGLLASMSAFLFGIYELITHMSKIPNATLTKVAESFGLISASMVALGLLLSYMSTFSTANIAVSASAIILTVYVISKVMESFARLNSVNLSNAVNSFKWMSICLMAVAGAFFIMKDISWSTALASSIAMGIVMWALSRVLQKITFAVNEWGESDAKKAIKAFALLGLTMLEIASAFLVMGKVNWSNAKASIIAMTSSIVAIAGALTVMSRYGGSDIQKAGFAAVLMGAALIEIAAAFAMMDKLQQNMGGTDRMVASFIALVGVMAIFAGIAYALSGVADKIAIVAIVMVVMAGALFLVGTAAALAGVGFEKFANGLAKLVENDNYKKFPDVLKEIAIGITQNAPLIAEAFITVIAESLRVLREGWAQIRDNVYFFIQEFFKMKIAAFGAGIEGVLEYLSDNIYKFTVMGMLILGGFLQGIEENIEWVTDEAVLIAVNFMNGLSKHMPELIEAGANLIESVMSGVSNKMNDINYQMKIAEDVWGFISGAFGFAAAWEVKKAEKWKELGKNLIEGIKKGLADAIPDLIAAADAPSKLFLTAMQKAFGIASPSKETYWIATMLVAGLHNGIVDKTQLGVDSAKYLADKTIDSFDGAMKAGLFGSMKQFGGEVEDAAKKIDEGGLKAAGSIIQNKVANALKEQFGIDNLEDFMGFKMDLSSLGIDGQMNDLLQNGDIEGYLKQFTNGVNVDEYLKEMDAVVSSTYTATDSMQDLNNLSQEFWGSVPTDNPYADKLYEIGDAAQYGSTNIEQAMKDMESISGKSAVGIVTSAVGGAAEILNETQHSYRNMLHGYNLFRTDNDDLTSAQKRYSKLFFDDLREKLYSKTKEDPRLNNYLNTMSDNDWEQIFFKWYNYSRKNGNTEKSADMFSDEILGRLLDSAEKFEESGESFANTLTPVIEAGKYNGSVSYDGEVTDRGTLKEMAYAYAAQQEARDNNSNKVITEMKALMGEMNTNVVNLTKRVFEANYGIVLDSGQLVGALTPGVDAVLGANALLAKRG